MEFKDYKCWIQAFPLTINETGTDTPKEWSLIQFQKQVARFGLQEFILVTSLNAKNVEEVVAKETQQYLLETYFPANKF